MHEQLIREFAERAEASVQLPDLDALEERGHRRHRNRLASVAAAAVLAVAVTGVGILASTGGDDGRSRRRRPPTPGRSTWTSWCRTSRSPRAGSTRIPSSARTTRTRSPTGSCWWRSSPSSARTGTGSRTRSARRLPASERERRLRPTPRSGLAGRPGPDRPVPRGHDRSGWTRRVRRSGSRARSRRSRSCGSSTSPRPRSCRAIRRRTCSSRSPAVPAVRRHVPVERLPDVEHAGSRASVTVFRPGQIVDLWVVDVDGSMVVVSDEPLAGSSGRAHGGGAGDPPTRSSWSWWTSRPVQEQVGRLSRPAASRRRTAAGPRRSASDHQRGDLVVRRVAVVVLLRPARTSSQNRSSPIRSAQLVPHQRG